MLQVKEEKLFICWSPKVSFFSGEKNHVSYEDTINQSEKLFINFYLCTQFNHHHHLFLVFPQFLVYKSVHVDASTIFIFCLHHSMFAGVSCTNHFQQIIMIYYWELAAFMCVSSHQNDLNFSIIKKSSNLQLYHPHLHSRVFLISFTATTSFTCLNTCGCFCFTINNEKSLFTSPTI